MHHTLTSLEHTLALILPTPSMRSHPHISEEELKYILDNRDPVDNDTATTPWKAIFSSIPMWGIIIMQFCNNWVFYTLMTCLPTYFNDVLRFSISQVSYFLKCSYNVQ